ncbi:molybdate ABC transporter substrate-binding protein [Roseibium aggregatum]|uniref:Molybdate ABC transporter substrate-binding protein n=1 Tax=Roseibium aggregatum TaxID=187304 RepID=A0A939EH13_9HYPH|nr:molybdate ABC transporter substrate-binding protein [Roseibium aggregatum]MBN9673052.1 molybdate ABC transporter substrate-binding protein [Roseibium aggregatum]
MFSNGFVFVQRLLVSLVLFAAMLLPVPAAEPLTVFAAASMRDAMERIGTSFEKETGTPVVFSFAGTGTIARQVEAGAPADVFVSADTAWMEYVTERDAVRPETIRVIAGNGLVLVGPKGSPELELSRVAIAARLSGQRLAMADPETVPAGRYGKAALEHLQLWRSVEGNLALMENVRVALATVARGDTPLGLVYATDAAIEPEVTVVARFPKESYPEIAYPAAVTTVSGNPQAEAFVAFLNGLEAKEILRSFGFVTDNGE